MKSYSQLIQLCDEEIRSGRADQARARLHKTNTSLVPLESRLDLAKICRRVGLYPMGLKLLAKVLFSKRQMVRPPRPEEFAEYAVLLLRSGALTEAMQILSKPELQTLPDVHLFRAYGFFLGWRFREAIPVLQTYIQVAPSPYARAIGQANLANAWVELNENDSALGLLEETIEWLRQQQNWQLLNNCYGLRAQIYLHIGDFSQAKQELNQMRQHQDSVQNNDQFLARKLDLIVKSLETRSLDPIVDLRALASKKRDWESLREADLYALQVMPDEPLLRHLYFGSPFMGFHERMQRELGRLPTEQEFILGDPATRCFDIHTGQIDGQLSRKAGTKCHQLLEILLRDFYRPVSVAGLFSELFIGERFDIVHSPGRVHQIIRRTRQWLKQERISVLIRETAGFYSLHITGEISFRLPLLRQPVSHMQLHLLELKQAFKESPFTTGDVRQALGISKTTVFRFMTWAYESGKVERLAQAQTPVKYKIAS